MDPGGGVPSVLGSGNGLLLGATGNGGVRLASYFARTAVGRT